MKSTLYSHISGPYSFENLSIFLLHGEDRIPNGSYRALHRALEKRTTAVHETGHVGELLIENLGDLDIFVQAGDIVKGGRQDRVIGVDFIIGKKSGRVPVPSFCVEKQRWIRRGGESDSSFSSSDSYVSSKSIKSGVILEACQQEVWNSVAEEQSKLSCALNSPVYAAESPSSYQLTLEHEKLQERIQSYLGALSNVKAGHADAIGFAFAIAGEINCADVYGSHDLFDQLWDKLLKAVATEAVAESGKVAKCKLLPQDIERFLEKTGLVTQEPRFVAPRVQLQQYSSEQKFCFETEDLGRNSACVHANVISC